MSINKKLLIIPSFINPDELLNHDSKATDILALTPMAMVCLDAANISYKTAEDFYDTQVFKSDFEDLKGQTEEMFLELDKICGSFISFPSAYTGNIVYFLRLFANLFYLENIACKIEQLYSQKYLLSDIAPKKLSWDNLTYSDLKSIPQTKGLENKVQILRALLHIEEVPLSLPDSSQVPYLLKIEAVMKRIPRLFKKGIKEKRLPILNNWNVSGHKKASLFVMQDGYEVGFLRKHMLDFKFISPGGSLRKKIPALSFANYDFNQIKQKLTPFLETNFPKTKSLIESLFLSYHREVVGGLNLFKKSFEQLVDRDDPKSLLFSVGTRDVVDSIFSYIANKKNIPIMYFQHGGETIFVKDIFQKYMEMDSKIKKTLILYSKVEKDKISQKDLESRAFGSIKCYQSQNGNSNKANDKALYCCSPFTFYNYTNFFFNSSDKQLYKVSRDILESCKDASLGVDIKLHPVQEDYNFKYYKKLISTVKYPKAKIIYGQAIESILKSYGLMILDFAGTAVLPLALKMKIAIVLYLSDLSLVNEHVLSDLKERCYIVQDRESLNEVLKKYAAGNLPCKWSEDIIDRYVYPVNKGHPGENIANYIRSVCQAN